MTTDNETKILRTLETNRNQIGKPARLTIKQVIDQCMTHCGLTRSAIIHALNNLMADRRLEVIHARHDGKLMNVFLRSWS